MALLSLSSARHWRPAPILQTGYAGTTGAEVVPFETNGIDASNSVLSRDWSRYLADIEQANVLINGLDDLKSQALVSDAECRQWQADDFTAEGDDVRFNETAMVARGR